MKYLMVCILLISMCVQTFAHSGRTDSQGCHAGSRPYHCHNGNINTSSPDITAEVYVLIGIITIALIVVVAAVGSSDKFGAYSVEENVSQGSIEPTYEYSTNTFGMKFNYKF